MSSSPDGIYDPGVIDPGIPVKNSTNSFWISESSPIAKLQSPWVNAADVVIIGSGMSGMNLARTIYQKMTTCQVVIIDARDICSGATGRNGGHIKAMSYNVWLDRKQRYGVEEAIRLTVFEHSHLGKMTAAIQEDQIDCDLTFVDGIDAYYDSNNLTEAILALDDMRKSAPHLSSQYTVHTAQDKIRALGCSERCVGAIVTSAASVWPYKMVTALLDKMVQENGLCVQTNTNVISVADSNDTDCAVVQTDHGAIKAKIVVHATNGWMGHLVPELRPYISPVRGNVIHQVIHDPVLRLTNSFWHRYTAKDWDYLIQRPKGDVVVGRANIGRRATGDDSQTDFCPQIHLRGVISEMYMGGQFCSEITHSWSGILGYTQDGAPFAGRLPFSGHTHQWVCGGYHGIGMIKAFRMAEMVARMIVGEDVTRIYPRSFFVTEQRMKKLKQSLRAKQKL